MDDITEKAVFERQKSLGRACILLPEFSKFLDQLGQGNYLSEERVFDLYDCGSWHYTKKAVEAAGRMDENIVSKTLLPIAGTTQPEKWYCLVLMYYGSDTTDFAHTCYFVLTY